VRGSRPGTKEEFSLVQKFLTGFVGSIQPTIQRVPEWFAKVKKKWNYIACNLVGCSRRVLFNSRRFGKPYLFHLHIQSPMKMVQIWCYETSAIKHHTPGKTLKITRNI
jgi:hypothetical protein